MSRIIIIFAFFSFNLTFGQNLQNGLIFPNKNEGEEICCVYMPKQGFEIYDHPDGELVGRLTKNVEQNAGDQSDYRVYFVDFKNKTETQIRLEYFQEIGYEIWALTYFERRNGFVKLRYDEKALWLKESDIQNEGFELVEWQSFLSQNLYRLLGFYANDPGLNLRERPNEDSKLIKTLRGDTNHIIPTNESSGHWTKVKVIISKEHPCGSELKEEENIIQELAGWIKIVDDNGLPNIWYYSRGC